MEGEEGKIRFEDSNLAMLGSIYEKALRMQRAEAEPEWKKINKAPGLYIWRIEKFNVVPWPVADYGKFYQGDTFIILSITKNEVNDSLDFTAHMWVGKDTTCDESGTGAYKIVELDDYFNREITLIYEEQDFESFIFLSYFKEIEVMQGGIETGFKKVGQIEYSKHLFHVKKEEKCIASREVPIEYTSLNANDVFVLDAGLKIYIWKGSLCSPFEKFNGAAIAKKLANERAGKAKIEEFDEGSESDEFKSILGYAPEKKVSRLKAKKKSDMIKMNVKRLLKLHENDGNYEMNEMPYEKETLKSDGIFLIDRGDVIFIWCGKDSKKEEKKFGIVFARKYQLDQKRNKHLPIIQCPEGKFQKEIDACFS